MYLTFCVPEAKKQLFRVLGQKPGACLQILGLAKSARFDCDRGSDSIAVAFVSSQPE